MISYEPVRLELKEGLTEVTVINENGEEETLVSTRLPHKDLFDAMSGLAGIFCRHMEIPDEMKGRVHARGLRKKETKDASGFIIMASINCPGTISKLDVRSPMLEKVFDIYWTMKGKDGNPVNLPERHLDKLLGAECAMCELALVEAGLFAKEGKTRRSADLLSGLEEKEEKE